LPAFALAIMAERAPYDVFLSHAASDTEVARALAFRLRDAGMRVFFDADSIRPGDEVGRVLNEAVGSAALTVVLIGPMAGSSRWMSLEVSSAAALARAGQSLLIPVLVGDVSPAQVPDTLRSFPAMRAAVAEDLEQVVDAITRALAKAGRAPGRELRAPSLPAVPGEYADNGVSDRIVAAIETSVRERSGPVQVVGLGGAGKTTATIAACHQIADRFTVLAWITATTEHAVMRGLARLASDLGVPGEVTADADLAAAVLDRLTEADDGWLVVFDDAEGGEGWLSRWVPATSATGTAVVISRQLMRLPGPVVEVGLLSDAAALAILERYIGTPLHGDDARSVTRLLAEVGGATPLTLALLAGQLRSDDGSLGDRVESLLTRLSRPPTWEPTTTVATLLAATLRELTTHHPVVAGLTRLLAVIGDKPVPEVLLRQSADDPFLRSSPAEVTEALTDLEASGLIQVTSGAIVLAHRLVADVVEPDETPAEPLEFLRRAVARRRNIERPDDRELTLTTDVARHALAEAARDESAGTAAAAALLSVEVARTLHDAGDTSGAALLLQETLQTCEATLGADHVATLTTRADLAGVLQAAGRLQDAALLLQQTLVASEQLLGPDDPFTLSTRANLATAFQSLGRFEEAAALLEQTLIDSESVLGPDHPSTLALRANLATVLLSQGRAEEAAALLQRTLTDSERVLGAEHPSTLTTRANLAVALRATGNVADADALLEETLTASERLLGPDDPLTVAVRQYLQHARVGGVRSE
jgi:tetratricopeptide (TPR) repeat protein